MLHVGKSVEGLVELSTEPIELQFEDVLMQDGGSVSNRAPRTRSSSKAAALIAATRFWWDSTIRDRLPSSSSQRY